MRRRDTQPIPGHVHPSATAYRAGCGCIKCVSKVKEGRIRRETLGSNLVDATPVREHVVRFIDEGYSYEQLAAASRVSPSIIKELADPKLNRKRMQRASARSLMGLNRRDLLAKALDGSSVPSAGAIRRVQALQRIGWSLRALSANDTEYERLGKIMSQQRPGIEAYHHRWIARLYDKHWDTPGASALAKARAVRLGLAPPLAWDDDTIDDPNARPDTTGMPQVSRDHPRHQQILALHGQGLSDRKIAAAIGVTGDAVRYWRMRIGLTPNTPGRSIPLGDEPDDRYRLWQDGHSDQQIADKTGKHPDLIGKWRRRHGLEAAGRWPAA